MYRVFLIGYMGSGKTTLGKLLASKLGYSFVDMDAYIEEKQFKTVSQIFDEKGESEFRILEKKYLHEISQFENVIISTGGGTPCYFDNMEFMNSCGVTVYLKLTPDELKTRLENSRAGKRPLLAERKGDELLQFIIDGLAKRERYYSMAILQLEGNIEEIIAKIIDKISR